MVWENYLFTDVDSAKLLIEQGKTYAKAANNLIKLVEFTSL
jgi:hypothetical protein